MSKSVIVTGSSAYNTVSFTLSSSVDSLTITKSSFNIDSLLPTAGTVTVSGNFYNAQTALSVGYSVNENSYARGSLYDTSWTQTNPTRNISLTVQGTRTISTSTVFNSQNSTEREVTVYYNGGGSRSLYYSGMSGAYSSTVSITNTFTLGQKLILDAPPTFTVSSISYDTPYVYSGLTTASVTVSDASAKYGGNISSIAFTIGNQTVTRSDNGTLSILLDTGGPFTPTVTVTDSRGQTTTKSLDPITVNVYTAPSISFDVARTLNDGTPDDEGTYGLIEAELTFSDAVATAVAPSVVLTDDDGTQTTPSVTWYTDSSLATQVTWANVSSGDTVYGLFSGLSTQHSYQVSVRPRDSEGTGTAVTQTIAPAFYTIDFYAGGHGIAFGRPANSVGFFSAMDTTFEENVYIDLPEYQTASTTDKEIYDAIVALGWDSDVLIP